MRKNFIFVVLFFLSFAPQVTADTGSRSSPARTPQTAIVDANRPRLVAQLGHPRGVYSLDFSPDGRLIVTGGRSGVVWLWDLSSGRQLRSLGNSEFDVAFSADGRMVLTGSRDGTARLWDVANGQEIRRFKGHSQTVYAVDFSPDGKLALTGSRDMTARIWDVSNGREIRRLDHRGPVDSIEFSPDGHLIVTGSRNGAARLWNTADGRELQRLKGDLKGVFTAAFSPDGKSVAAGGSNGIVLLWDVSSGDVIRRFERHTKRVTSVVFSSDGQSLLTGSFDGTAKLWNVSTSERIREYVQGSTVRVVAFSLDGQRVFVGRDGGPAPLIFELSTGDPTARFDAENGAPVNVAIFSPDDRSILTGTADGTARFWDLAIGRQVRRFEGHTKSVSSIAFFPDGKSVITGSRDNTVRIWNVQNGKEQRRFEDAGSRVTLSRDGRLLVTGGKAIKLWDVASSTEKKRFGGGFGFYQVALSPDEQYVLTGGDGPGKGAHLWNITTGEDVRHFKHGGYVGSVAFSPDGKTVLTAGGFQPIARHWDIASGLEIQNFKGHSQAIYAVDFSPDGKLALTGSSDMTARLWDVASGEEVLQLVGHSGELRFVSFSFDGRYILTASPMDQTSRIWDVSTGEDLARLISFRDGSWAVVDPEGRFDASKGGDINGLHWVVGLEPIALDQLKERYYDPGLLAKKLGFNSQPLRDVEAFTNPKLHPLVETEPLEPDSETLRIKLTNRGGGVGRVIVLINGKEVTSDARGTDADPDAESLELEVKLADHPYLIPGKKNIIEVRAFNAEGYLSSRGVRTVYEPPGKAPLQKPTLWAIIGGISDYEGERIDLRYAAKDAGDFANALKLAVNRLFGADNYHVTLLSTAGRQMVQSPTKAGFEQAFADFKAAKPWDILVIYLAGHGVAVGDRYYYLTREARSADLTDPAIRERVAISSVEMVTWLKQSPALKQVMVLDTCAAGSAAKNLVENRSISSDQIRAIERLKDRTGFHVLMGSAADAVSYEATQYQQGLLTYALLNGMRGPALRVGEYVDVSKLFQHAADEVPRLASHIGGIQRPQIAAPRGTSFDIGQLKIQDQQNIPLAQSKPMILRPVLQNAEELFDNLELTEKVRRRLREVSYASLRGEAQRLPAVYVDANQLAGAVRPSGNYRIEGDTVEANLVLVKDGKKLESLQVQGFSSDLEGFSVRIVDEIVKATGNIK
jgi:WD40 repeat protein